METANIWTDDAVISRDFITPEFTLITGHLIIHPWRLESRRIIVRRYTRRTNPDTSLGRIHVERVATAQFGLERNFHFYFDENLFTNLNSQRNRDYSEMRW